MRLIRAGFAFEWSLLWRSRDSFLVLVNTPFLTLILLAITRNAGREDLAAYAVLAPALMALWSMALLVAGEIVDVDRSLGTLEGLVATPGSFTALTTGRIAAVTTVSLVGFAEAWLVALAFGELVVIHHPVVFAATVLVTALATAGTASVMAAVFVLARSARIFQNSLSYPFFVLGGVMVPLALLPEPVQWAGRVVYLSWSADLLRDAVAPGPVDAAAVRLLVVLGLGALGYAAGAWLLRRVLMRVRTLGTLTYA